LLRGDAVGSPVGQLLRSESKDLAETVIAVSWIKQPSSGDEDCVDYDHYHYNLTTALCGMIMIMT